MRVAFAASARRWYAPKLNPSFDDAGPEAETN